MSIVRLALKRPYSFVVVAFLIAILGVAAIIAMPVHLSLYRHSSSPSRPARDRHQLTCYLSRDLITQWRRSRTGRHSAYSSSESPQTEVYVQPCHPRTENARSHSSAGVRGRKPPQRDSQRAARRPTGVGRCIVRGRQRRAGSDRGSQCGSGGLHPFNRYEIHRFAKFCRVANRHQRYASIGRKPLRREPD